MDDNMVQDVMHHSTSNTFCKVETNQNREIESRQILTNESFKSTVMLATACVRVQNGVQISENCRALLDTGAQMNLITCKCMKKLMLPAINCKQPINGVAGSQILTSKVRIFIGPAFESNFSMQIELLVMDDFCGLLPALEIPTVVPTGIRLADPGFRIPAEVQMLLGAEVWAKIAGNDMYRNKEGTVLQDTYLGYICFGRVVLSNSENSLACLSLTLQENDTDERQLSELLQRFWRIEEESDTENMLSVDEKAVEIFFQNTYHKKNGRYVVQIPFKENVFPLADSRNIVLRRFHQLERKLQRDNQIRQKYIEFMREYIELNHMQIATKPPLLGKTVYIPHHAVVSKFRVVFDGSCKNIAGTSLNKLQKIGPKLQLDLQDQIMCFRLNKIGFIADISKMFRQVLIDESQWDLQRIFWREGPNDPIREYWLKTVTYGLASSVYNAVRALIQCARDYAARYPLAAYTIEKKFYIDDGLMGAENLQKAIKLAEQVKYVLLQGGFELSKWASNSKELLDKMADQSHQKEIAVIDEDKETKVLGLRWITETDELAISAHIENVANAGTKREMLSIISRIYDPNGFIAPIVIAFKMHMQDLWRHEKIGWDSKLPEPIKIRWRKLCSGLELLQQFRIPRWLKTHEMAVIQLHGFADASAKAYGCIIYVRTIDAMGGINCILLSAKSRVAPLKAMTIPRLELLAAELLSEQMQRTIKYCGIKNSRYFCWSDSSIVMGWIQKSALDLKTFVSNRIDKIQKRTKKHVWQHVKSQDNPADLVSRGMMAGELLQSNLWKNGPKWLLQPEVDWPSPKFTITKEMREQYLKECKPSNIDSPLVAPIMHQGGKEPLINTVSGWWKLLRITAYIFRFISNARMKNKRKRKTQRYLSVEEFENAANYWIKLSQSECYKAEISCITIKDDRLPANSKIAGLRPFMDKNGLLRVGGRIDKSLGKNYKIHPIIVPTKTRVCKLILQQAHFDTLCGGVQLMMAYVRNRYWIRCLRSEARAVVRGCVKCVRQAGRTMEQIMGDLPMDRLRPARPFVKTGVDLAGPINIRWTDRIRTDTRNRSALNEDIKGYIVVFVCLVTRAVHLEPVMAISAEAFIWAYKRFTARRGVCEKLYSDKGTNFVRADKDMKKAVKTWQEKSVQDFINWNGTQWTFITPSAPHQGGLWEAAVKQMKVHLKRIMGAEKYSYEALSTLLAEIEACMNSRPICAMSDDPSDSVALTPAHFLIGEPLKLPLPVRHDNPPKMAIGLYNELQARVNAFWRVWSEDYLSTLMERAKWKAEQTNLKAGRLV